MKALEAASLNPTPSEDWRATTCQGCTTWCSVQVQIQDGRAIKLRGNPHCKGNHGVICPRPHLALQQVYDPDRIKTPMKRTNPKKGRDEDPKFVPISWDEAMGLLADKMMELRKQGETHKFGLFRGRYTYMRDLIYSCLPKVFGSPNGISHSAICAEAEKFGAFFTEGFWGYRDYDLSSTKYFLGWGADPLASNRQVPHAISVWGDLMDRATVSVIDPRLSITAAKADEWLPIIPGEDGALAVAMAHHICVKGLWSREFVGDFNEGINQFIAGKQVPEASFNERHSYGIAKWWNLELKDKTPQWAAERTGIPVEQIIRVAEGFAKAAPHSISWVSPGTAMQVRGGYSAMAAHALNGLVGSVDHRGGTVQSTKIPINATPSYKAYQDEQAKTNSKKKKIDQRGTLEFPALKKGKSGGGVVTNRAADAILAEDPYDMKVVVSYWSNFAFSCSETKRWEDALTKLPFFVHITTHAAEMSHFADLVLPAAHHLFEKLGFIKSKQNLHGYVSLNEPVMESLWDVRMDESEIPWMLAEKLADRGFDNLLRYYKESFPDLESGNEPRNGREFTENALKYYTQPLWDSTHEKYGKYGDTPKGWEEFKTLGVWNTKGYEYGKHIDHFKTETKKFEFYSETLKKSLGKHAKKHSVTIDEVLQATKYQAQGELAFVPHYEEPFRWGDTAHYPFIFFEHRSRLNREGRSANCTWYHAHKDSDPGDENWDDVLKMNGVDAHRLGLKTGDLVSISSPTGKMLANLKIWAGVRPGTVSKCYGQGHWAYGNLAAKDFKNRLPKGGNNNDILPADYDRLSGSTARHGGVTRVNIIKV